MGTRLLSQRAGQKEGGETEGAIGGFGQEIELLLLLRSWLVEAVDW